MKRVIRYVLTRGVVLFIAGYVGAVLFMASREEAMLFPRAHLEGAAVVPEPSIAIPWDTLRIDTEGGSSTFLLESRLDDDASRLWALFFHGNGLLVSSDGSLDRIELLRDAGFNVLAVEFRGYGASATQGAPSESALYQDAVAAWRHLTGVRRVAPGDIVAYGWSLGGALATYLGAEHALGGLVTEGTFTSAPDAGAEFYPWLPVRTIMRNRFDNLERAPAISEPWVIFHGEADEIIPLTHAEALERAAPRARLHLLSAGHNDGVIADRERALVVLRSLVETLRGG